MNIIFLGSLICLGSSISVGDKQLSPLKKIANKSLITSAVTSSDLVKVILDHKKDPAYLLSVLSNVDPTKLNDVLLLVRALLAASEADLADVTQTSTTANTAYTDATTAYDAAVVARVDLQGTKTAFDVAFTANSALLDQQVAALLVAQTEAHGAKTNAQSTFDTETVRLNGEIETLKQVIALLEGLVGSTASANSSFQSEGTCTLGAYYGTQYTENQTPTIDDCEAICRGEVGCVAFTYGNVAGYKGAIISDGRRANDCIMTKSPYDKWPGKECRWNVYSLTGEKKVIAQIDFGNLNQFNQEGWYPIGGPDGTGGTISGTVGSVTVTASGYGYMRGAYNAVTSGPDVGISNLLRSSILCNYDCTIQIHVTGLTAGRHYSIKSYHHDTNAPRGGAPFSLSWNGGTVVQLKQSANGEAPNPATTYTADVTANVDGRAVLLITSSANKLTGAHVDVNGLEIRG